MYCEKCGTPMNSNSAACPNCGNINSDNSPRYNTSEIPKVNMSNMHMNNAYYAANINRCEEVSIARWIGRMLIPWIPFVGGIINFIMLIVWACSDRFEKSSKNWAVARIVITLIQIVISVIAGIFVYAVLIELFNDPAFQMLLGELIYGV